MAIKYSGDAAINKMLSLLKSLIAGKESSSNKVVSVSAESTDTEYPSAKAVNSAISSAISSQTTETWTFTLKSGDTVTKTVVLK